ncbi:hypothetical protein PSAC2689_40223 [Paraburkholderia sacchari]
MTPKRRCGAELLWKPFLDAPEAYFVPAARCDAMRGREGHLLPESAEKEIPGRLSFQWGRIVTEPQTRAASGKFPCWRLPSTFDIQKI